MKSLKEIQEMAGEIAGEMGLFVVDVEVAAGNAVRVEIDSMTGVDVGTCRAFSRRLEEGMDREGGDFELTVASAGIGYPFKVAGQYEKNLGREVEARLTDGRRVRGVLLRHGPGGIAIEVEERVAVEGRRKRETRRREVELGFPEIKEVKDIVVFK